MLIKNVGNSLALVIGKVDALAATIMNDVGRYIRESGEETDLETILVRVEKRN